MLCAFKVLHRCNSDAGVQLLTELWWDILASWAIPTTATSSPRGILQAPTRLQDTKLLFWGGSMAQLSSPSVLLKGAVEHAPSIAEHLRENQRPWNPPKSLRWNWKIFWDEI